MNNTDVGYVDGFVLVVPVDKTDAYKNMAQEAADIWKKHGALSYSECQGDDLKPDTNNAPMLTFPELTNLQDGETVWFSFITYKSREHRDEVNKKVMEEMGKNCEDADMPFDVKRMSWGGFEVKVS